MDSWESVFKINITIIFFVHTIVTITTAGHLKAKIMTLIPWYIIQNDTNLHMSICWHENLSFQDFYNYKILDESRLFGMGQKVSQSCCCPGCLWEMANLTRSEWLMLLYTCPHLSGPCEASAVSPARPHQLSMLTKLQLTLQERTHMAHISWEPSQTNHSRYSQGAG